MISLRINLVESKHAMSYRWMFICKSVVDGHVMEVWSDKICEILLNYFKFETRVDEHGSEVCFDHIREALSRMSVAYARFMVLILRS